MTAATHYAFSFLVLAAAGFEHGTALASSVFALLPDVDHPDSLIGRVFGPLSQYIQRRWGHRTITHSVFAILAVMLFLLPLSLVFFYQVGKFPTWYAAASLAFASHVFIDLFNRSGVRLFAPFSNKEYISFRTPGLRILVNSLQEYVLLFVIVFFAFSISQKPFSIHAAVRSFGKHFFKTYDTALKDFQDNAHLYCIADISYYSEIDRHKKVERLPVIALYPSKGIFLKNGERLCLRRDLIDEITIIPTRKPLKTIFFKGNDLKNIPKGYYTGTVIVYHFSPDVLSSDFIEIKRYSDKTIYLLYSADARDIAFLTSLETTLLRERKLLEAKLLSNQISKLKLEELRLKSRISLLKNNLYDNYGKIQKLSDTLRTLQVKIKTLEVQEELGADAEIKLKLESLNNATALYEIGVIVF